MRGGCRTDLQGGCAGIPASHRGKDPAATSLVMGDWQPLTPWQVCTWLLHCKDINQLQDTPQALGFLHPLDKTTKSSWASSVKWNPGELKGRRDNGIKFQIPKKVMKWSFGKAAFALDDFLRFPLGGSQIFLNPKTGAICIAWYVLLVVVYLLCFLRSCLWFTRYKARDWASGAQLWAFFGFSLWLSSLPFFSSPVSSSVFMHCLPQQGLGLSTASRKQHHNTIKTCSFQNSPTSVNRCELGSDPSNLIRIVQKEPVMVWNTELCLYLEESHNLSN